MRKTLGFFDRLFLSFYSPKKTAHLLGSIPSEEAIKLLKSMKPSRSIEIIEHWSEKTRTGILNNLDDYCIKMLRRMSPEQQSFYVVRLHSVMVKKFAAEISYKELSKMMVSWSKEERIIVFAKLPQVKASKLFHELPLEHQVNLVVHYKPWIASALMEGLSVEARAAILDQMEGNRALDLFDRIARHMKGEVLLCLSEARVMEIVGAIRPRSMAEIIKDWSPEQVQDLLVKFDFDRRAEMIRHLSDELQSAILPLFPKDKLHEVIEHVKPPIAARYLFDLDKEERDEILKRLLPSVAASIRRLMLAK
ncbi:MAG TPA: hypothetical protein VMX35_04010 [Acidobacteriota bacterium]|nr:hypothetical protein [Acidobacteriota bacterium]